MPALLALFLGSAFLTGIAVEAMRRWAERRRFLDLPNARSSHTRPTPRGGGLPIAVLTLGAWLACAAFLPGLGWPRTLAFAAAAGLVAGVSWIDDLRSLPAAARLAAHGAAAVWSVWLLGAWTVVELPLAGSLDLGGWGFPLAVFWLTGLTNAYNFMDGIDGIAGAQGLLAGLAWTVLGGWCAQPAVEGLGGVLAGACLGFLVHNWPPARIFMGDVGSAFLGFAFAALPLLLCAQAAPGEDAARAPLAGVLVVWPFVFDTVFTLVRRLLKGEQLLSAHRSHLYQRLVIAGCSHRLVTCLYLGLAFLGALLALAWFARLPGSEMAVLLAVPWLGLGLWAVVVYQERKRR